MEISNENVKTIYNGHCDTCVHMRKSYAEPPCNTCKYIYEDNYERKNLTDDEIINLLEAINPRTMNARDWYAIKAIVKELKFRRGDSDGDEA